MAHVNFRASSIHPGKGKLVKFCVAMSIENCATISLRRPRDADRNRLMDTDYRKQIYGYMQNVYVARQPIFDKNKSIFAYELLFRDGTGNCVPDIDGDVATTTLLADTFFGVGMERLVGGRKSFINFTQNLLEKKVPLLLPKTTTVVEILEDVIPGPKVIDACAQLVAEGYTLALDDFVYCPGLEPLIAMADIIKFDFRLSSINDIADYLRQLADRGIRLLAEKVETYDEFQSAVDMGFELFQGYFFCKPELIHGYEIQGTQLNLMTIMAQINKHSLNWDELEVLIARDMGIAYKLFKYINSAFFSRANKVASVKQALIFLGEEEVRRFIALIAMSRLAEGKPHELIRAACIRGRFCELMATCGPEPTSPSEMFTLGMFSLIDAVIDQPMEKILGTLPLADPIKRALIDTKGRLAGYIELVRAYETGKWGNVTRLADALKLDGYHLPDLYLQACQWSDRTTKAA